MIDIKATLTKIMEALRKDAVIAKNFQGESFTINGYSSAYTDIPFAVPNGYKYVMATVADTCKNGIIPRTCGPMSSSIIRVYVDNRTATAITTQVIVRILYTSTFVGGGKKFITSLNRTCLWKEVGVC